MHHGGFENISATYAALVRWIEMNGYRIVGPNRELYLRNVLEGATPAQYPTDFLTGDPNERLTEVQFPVAKA